MTFRLIAELPIGPERTAALAEWFQSLFSGSVPVLVGGAAVELYTRGGYVTGDLDFVGNLSSSVIRKLEKAGFRREGRHWIHDAGKVYLELPASSLEPEAEVAEIRVGRHRVLAVSPEDVVVDRLAAWQFWKSSADAIGAYLVWRSQSETMDRKRLDRLAAKNGVRSALRSLVNLARRTRDREPAAEELERWAFSWP
jgi:hypothetical protein